MGKIAIRVDDDSEVSHMRLTGESVATIAEHGFVLLTPVPQERAPLTVDWDEVDARRHVFFPWAARAPSWHGIAEPRCRRNCIFRRISGPMP